eukprot:1432511-Pyramimonas_sp.AAC.1
MRCLDHRLRLSCCRERAGGDTAPSASPRPLGDTVGLVASLCSAATLRLGNSSITPNMRGCEEGAVRNEEGEGAAPDWASDRDAA